MKKILFTALSILLILPIVANAPSFALNQQYDPKEVKVVEEKPDPNGQEVVKIAPQVDPATCNKSLYNETDSNNVRVEIKCENGQFTMSVHVNGKTIYVGKCPFDNGVNYIQKLVKVVGNNVYLNSTQWKSFNATTKAIDVNKRSDVEWNFDAQKMILKRQNTTHYSMWDGEPGNSNYSPFGIKPKDPEKDIGLPSTPEGLGWNLQTSASHFRFQAEPQTFVIPAPLKQLKLGFLSDNVICTDNYILIKKLENNSPACVKPSASEILVQHGWAQAHLAVSQLG